MTNEKRAQNLFMSITSVDVGDNVVGYKIIDLYHYGTRSWLANHQWWAMHNNVSVEVRVATDEEVQEFMAKKAKQLQDHYSSEVAA